MPPKQAKSAAEIGRIPVLRTYKCYQCAAFKGPEHFSNTELNKYRYKKITAPQTNGITAGLRCRTCAGAQVFELRCKGPCGKDKALSEFSKNSRTQGHYWCQECILWKEGVTPEAGDDVARTPAPPGQQLAPDEQDGWLSAPTVVIGNAPEEDGDSDSDNQGDDETEYGSTLMGTSMAIGTDAKSGFFGGGHGVELPYDSFSALKLQDLQDVESREARNKLQLPGYVPPHLKGMAGSSHKVSQQHDSDGVPSASTPHTKTKFQDDLKSQSSVSNPYEESGSTFGTVTREQVSVDYRQAVPYTAYGHNGEVAQRYAAQASPSFAPATRSSNKGWSKAVGKRNSQLVPQARPSESQRHNYYAGSDDEA